MRARFVEWGALVRRHWPQIVPQLSHAMHKGSCGRIAVVGGSVDYSGAPYFAAISAMHCGADLAYVFCPPDAALAIKAYSPDLCVRPLLSDAALDECLRVVGSCHAVVVGPGVGDGDDAMRERLLPAVVARARRCGIPLVVDTAVMCFPQVLAQLRAGAGGHEEGNGGGAGFGKAPTYLTPNGREMLLLAEAVLGADAANRYRLGDITTQRSIVADTADAINVVITVKGFEDFVHDGWSRAHHGAGDGPTSTAVSMLCPGQEPSPRRAAGQGDLFAGTLGCFAAWANIAATTPADAAGGAAGASDPPLSPLVPPACASLVVRQAAHSGFASKGRSLLASDVCANIGAAMDAVDRAMAGAAGAVCASKDQ